MTEVGEEFRRVRLARYQSAGKMPPPWVSTPVDVLRARQCHGDPVRYLVQRGWAVKDALEALGAA